MTDLYRISIDDKTGASVRGRVHIINPDAEEVPPGRDFPLRMIIEVWHRMREGYFFESIDRNLPDDQLHRDWDEVEGIANSLESTVELERLWGLDHGANVYLTDEQVAEVQAAVEIREPEQREAVTRTLKERYCVERLNLNRINENWYLSTERDGDAFYRHACEIVTDYQVGEMRNWPPPWEFEGEFYDGLDLAELLEEEYGDEFDVADFMRRRERGSLADYPYSEFTFSVKDARYVEHLGGGIHFSTAIYGEFGW